MSTSLTMLRGMMYLLKLKGVLPMKPMTEEVIELIKKTYGITDEEGIVDDDDVDGDEVNREE